MKSADIQIGEEYAISSAKDMFNPLGSRPSKGKVIGAASERRHGPRGGWVVEKTRVVRGLPPFAAEVWVPSREVRMLWSEYEVERDRIEHARLDRVERIKAEQKARAERAWLLEVRARRSGIKTPGPVVGRGYLVELLEQAGYEVKRNPEAVLRREEYEVHTVFANLENYVVHGTPLHLDAESALAAGQ